MATAAAVWVDVLPSMKGFGAALNKELSGVGENAGQQLATDTDKAVQRGLTGTGERAGRNITRGLGSTISGTAGNALQGLNNAFDRTFNWANDLATYSGNRISRSIGQGVRATLTPLAEMRQMFIDAVDAFTSGFQGASTEATGFARVAQGAGSAVGQTWELARAPVDGFKLGFRDATGAAGQFSSTSRGLAGPVGNAFQRVGGTLGRVRDGFTNSLAAASAFSGRAGTLGGAARRAWDGVTGSVQGMTERLRTAGQTTSSLLAPLGRVGAWAAGAAVASSLSLIGLAGGRVAIQVENSRAALTGLYGSGEMANDMLARLRGLASGSPIEYSAFLRGAESLAYMGYSGQTAVTVLERTNAALVASGKGAAAMDQVNYAMLEMINTGKVYAAQLTQMSQAGLPVWSMLADHMGMSIAEVREQVTKGTVEIDTVMQAIQAGGGETFKRMEAAAAQSSRTLSATWARTRDNVSLAVADMLAPFTGGAANMLGAAGDALTGAFRALPGLFAQVSGFLGPMIAGFRATAGVIGGGLMSGLSTVAGIFGSVLGPAINWVTGILNEHKGILYVVGAFLAGWTASLVITQGAMLAVRTATMLWAGAQWVLNAALNANPFGLIIGGIAALVAGVVYAYNNFGWFRDIVQSAWSGIVSAAQGAWGFLQGVFSFLGSAVTATGNFFSWLWQVAVSAWNGIAGAASWAWSTLIKPTFDALWFGLRFLGAVIFTIYVLPWKLAFDLVAAAAMWAWNTVLSPVFGWIGARLGELGAWFGTVYSTRIKPAWDMIGLAISVGYNTVILPIFNMARVALAALGAFFGWVYSVLIKPAWDSVGGVIRNVYNSLILPTWNLLRAALGGIGQWFQQVYANWIKPAWDAVGSAVRWVYDVVIRPAFDAVKFAVHSVGQAFQNVSDWIRDAWAKIRGYAEAPVRFVVDTVYNSGIRPVWNWIQDKFGLNMPLPEARFAGGGVLPGYAPGRDTVPAMLSPGEAVLTPEAVRFLGPATILGLNSQLSGRKSASGEGTVHAAGGWLSSVWDAATSVAGGVWSGIKDVASAMGDLMSGPLEWIKKQLSPYTGGLAKFGDAPWVQAMTNVPKRFIDAAVEKVKAAFMSGDGGAYGMVPVSAAGAGVQRWAPLVLQALAMMGQPASYLGITLRRMNQESGGNPNIGNYWDINAKRGTPSMGLMQVIGPTFASYRDPRAPNNILDPLANILASMRYALSRYGSLPAAYNKPGGYRKGGWLMPGEFAYNETKRPEPILSSEQWDDFRRMSRGGDGNRITVNTKTDASPDHIAHTIDRHIAMRARL